nr:uncharacterized protein LOC127329029 [Lolium perenne]
MARDDGRRSSQEAPRDRGQQQRGGAGGGQGATPGNPAAAVHKPPAQGAAGQHKGKNKAKGGGGQQSGQGNGGECFRCGRAGNFQSECEFDPLCVLCIKEGHISANCPTRGKALRLQAMGFAITGGGFYNIEVEPIRDEEKSDQFMAVIKFDKQQPLSAIQLSDELKNLVDDLWDWQVAKVSKSEFTVCFPSRATLKISTGSGKLYLLLSKAEVSIREAFLPPRPGKAFPTTWVKLTGLPRDMIEKDRLMAGMVMIGRPLEVDELSRRKWTTEPVRMRFQCRFPERIKGTVQLTVNGEPYTVGVQAELGRSGPGGAGDGGPPKPPAPPRDDDGDNESEEHSHEAWNRHGWKKNGDKDQCQGGEVDSQKGGGADSASLAAVLVPLARRSWAGRWLSISISTARI